MEGKWTAQSRRFDSTSLMNTSQLLSNPLSFLGKETDEAEGSHAKNGSEKEEKEKSPSNGLSLREKLAGRSFSKQSLLSPLSQNPIVPRPFSHSFRNLLDLYNIFACRK